MYYEIGINWENNYYLLICAEFNYKKTYQTLGVICVWQLKSMKTIS
jgi:hypothetical protein